MFFGPKIWYKINNDLKIVLTINCFTHTLNKKQKNDSRRTTIAICFFGDHDTILLSGTKL